MNRASRQRGHILVEFILVAPVLLAIAGGALEIARFLRFNQTASIVSQEAAVSAYRRCSDFFVFTSANAFNADATTTDTQSCLNDLRVSIQEKLNALYDPSLAGNPEFMLVLSVYRRDNVLDSTGSRMQIGFDNLTRILSASTPRSGTTPLTSQYGASGNAIVKTSPPLPSNPQIVSNAETRAMERIVIAEVAYRYAPVIPIYKILLGNGDFLKTDEGFRETTIL